MNPRKLMLAAALVASSATAHAGIFSTSAFGGSMWKDPGELIADIVTDDFTRKFPSDKYAIVWISGVTEGNAGATCYAIAGVGRKVSEGRTIPAMRFATTQPLSHPGPEAARECEKDVIRSSVQRMMNTPFDQLTKR